MIMSKLIKTENGWKLDWEGESFQDKVRLPEWKSALIVYEKYKRKMNLNHSHLIKLKDYIVLFSNQRAGQGKKTNKDFLIQECSAELKRWDINLIKSDVISYE